MEFWQKKKLKRNKEDVLQTARDVYNLPVEFETNEIRDVLDREGIPYKYKVKDRLGDWNGSGTFRGSVGSAGIPADQSKQYEILVEKKDMAQAQNVIKIKLS